jgi:hypothetical protein
MKPVVHFLFISFSVCFYSIVYCQGSPNPLAGFDLSAWKGGFSSGMTSFNLGQGFGTQFEISNYKDIEGTPYFTDAFSDSYIMMNTGKSYIGPKIKLNLYTQKLHFLSKDNTELIAQDGVIKKVNFLIKSDSESLSYTFGCGYPPVGNNTALTFYQEFNSGNAVFLNFISKSIVERKTLATINPGKEFSETSTYYVYRNDQNKIEKWRKGKEFILDFLSDKRGLINTFINDNNLACKSPQDAIKIIQFYNNLMAK